MPTRIVLRDGVPSTMEHQHHPNQQQPHGDERFPSSSPTSNYTTTNNDNNINNNRSLGGLRRIGSWDNDNFQNTANADTIMDIHLGPLASSSDHYSHSHPQHLHIGDGHHETTIMPIAPTKQQQHGRTRTSDVPVQQLQPPATPTSVRSSSNRRGSATTNITGFGGFRSSILVETQKMNVSHNDNPNEETHPNANAATSNAATATNRHQHHHQQQQQYQQQHISRADIRASPRLQGYLFNFTASMVMLVSVIQFYLKREHNTEINRRYRSLDEQPVEDDDNEFTTTFGTKVFTWKLYGALALSATGVFMAVFVLLAHFDTIFFPKLWKRVFRDGSKAERNLLLGLLLFWFIGLYICTSSFSVGEVQANVYFTTWIAFGSTALNFGVWRSSADLPSFWDTLLYDHPRETQHNWVWVFVFALIAALGVTEFHANRADLLFLIGDEVQSAPTSEWIKGLSSTWCAVGISLISICCNHIFQEPVRIQVGGRSSTSSSCTIISFDWRWIECLFILILLGLYTWIIIAYTGVNGVISGPSNPYFGVWGSFFCSIFTFGSWLKENKRYVVPVQELS